MKEEGEEGGGGGKGGRKGEKRGQAVITFVPRIIDTLLAIPVMYLFRELTS